MSALRRRLTVEFKESATPRIADSVAAMANTYGGLVVVGVTDVDRETCWFVA